MEWIGLMIAMLKSMGLGAVIGKLAVASKGLAVCANSGYIQHLGIVSLQMIQNGGFTYAAVNVVNMLIIIGTCTSGTLAVGLAVEALELFAKGKIKEGSKKAAQATKEAKATNTGIENMLV